MEFINKLTVIISQKKHLKIKFLRCFAEKRDQLK